MSNETLDIVPTVFLDTNALHYVCSYLRIARARQLPPYTEEPMEYDQVQAALRQELPRGIANMVMNGGKTIAFLQKGNDNDENERISVVASRLGKAEILFGVLDGQAHARMAREGMPYRMRQRQRDLSELVSMQLEREDYDSILREIDDTFSVLEDKAGIRIEFAEETVQDFSLISTFAEFLQSNVFLDVLDCWMYGCAIAVQAEQIITFDRYFRDVINRIHNPQGKEDWLQVQGKVSEQLSRLFPVTTQITLSVPLVQTLPKEAPEPWGRDNA